MTRPRHEIAGRRPLPRVFPLERLLDLTTVADPGAAVAAEMRRLYPTGDELRGMRIGLTAVSRQVANYGVLFRAVISELRARGASVFIIPAIGSHGGGTAAGNLSTLGCFGITEGQAVLDAPILPGPETSLVDIVDGVEVHCLTSVLNAVDGLFLFGRVRRHWDIRWAPGQAEALGCYPLESGLAKLFLGLAMMQARKLHDHGDRLGWAVQTAARRLLIEPKVNVIGALAVVDNEEEQTAIVHGVPFYRPGGRASPDDLFREEHELLERSQRFLPYFPFQDEECHLLYLHYFGKPYAGQGADTKIIGRNGGERDWCAGTPRFRRICASRLIGARDRKDLPGPFNAMGIGNLDFVTRRFYDAVDWELTGKNAVTAGKPAGAEAPRVVENDREMLDHALQELNPAAPRLMFAVSTVWMRLIYLSEAYLEKASRLSGFRIRGAPRDIPFHADGFIAFPAFDHV